MSIPLQDENLRPFATRVAAARPAAHGRAESAAFEVVRGRDRVLQWLPRLQDLAAACGQGEAVDHLPFHLSEPYFGRKEPHLLLRRGHGGEVEAAVLVHQYRLLGLRTGFFISADTTGEWTVLAPQEQRGEAALDAATFLMRGGARLVLISVAGVDSSCWGDRPLDIGQRVSCATPQRVLRRTLPLAATLDRTLATLGKRSRRNFRAYRRRAEKKFALRYVECSAVSDAEFAELNAGSAYAVPAWVADWHMRVLREAPGAFAAGLHAHGLGWLSMVGGRRRGDMTIIDWQTNRAEVAELSLGTVMRSYLLESESARGTRFLRFAGGTSHAMQNAFVPEIVCDLLLTRPLLRNRLVQKLLQALLPKRNLLATTVDWSSLQWLR